MFHHLTAGSVPDINILVANLRHYDIVADAGHIALDPADAGAYAWERTADYLQHAFPKYQVIKADWFTPGTYVPSRNLQWRKTAAACLPAGTRILNTDADEFLAPKYLAAGGHFLLQELTKYTSLQFWKMDLFAPGGELPAYTDQETFHTLLKKFPLHVPYSRLAMRSLISKTMVSRAPHVEMHKPIGSAHMVGPVYHFAWEAGTLARSQRKATGPSRPAFNQIAAHLESNNHRFDLLDFCERRHWLPGAKWSSNLPILKRAARELPDGGRILEMGIYGGASTSLLQDMCLALGKHCLTDAVDPCHDIGQPVHLDDTLDDWAEYLRHQINFANHSSRIDLHTATSDEFFSTLPPETKYDFIYVDGDHSYGQVIKDLDNALQHLTPTGILSGDDYNLKTHPDCKRAIDDFLHFHGLTNRTQFFGNGFWVVPGVPTTNRPTANHNK